MNPIIDNQSTTRPEGGGEMANHLDLTEQQRRKVAEFMAKHETGMVTLLFTDMVNSTRIKQDLGDAAGSALIDQHQAIVRDLLASFPKGEEINTSGDSFFLTFVRPSDSVRFALLLQAHLRKVSETTYCPIILRIGIHVGEVIIKTEETGSLEKDVLGLQVDTAGRIRDLAEGGQVLLSRGVFDNARAILAGQDIGELQPLTWLNHGRYRAKGVEEAIEICEVGEEGFAPLSAPKGSDKIQRYVSPDEEPVLGWRPAVGVEVHTSKGWILTQKLGEGSFGEVWLAHHKSLNEERVFKFCFRGDRVRSLKREVVLFNLLRNEVGGSPNIVRIYDTYFEEPPYYIAMEYVAGKNLKEWCEDHGGAASMPESTKLEVVAQVADALQAAHDSGVIHRDVKPSNILICGDPEDVGSIRVKLTDFGIGQVMSREILGIKPPPGFTATVEPTEISPRTGTRLYMAPEVIAGKPSSIRSDIYSLGVVLYQSLIGDLEEPLTTDWKKRIKDPILQEDLDACFAGDVSERFAGAGQLAQAMRTIEVRRRARYQEAIRESATRRRHRVTVFSSILAIVLTLVAVVMGYALKREAQLRQEAVISRENLRISQAQVILEADRSRNAEQQAIAEKEKAERQSYVSQIRLALHQITSMNFSEARETLLSCSSDWRSWEWQRLFYLSHPPTTQLSCEPGLANVTLLALDEKQSKLGALHEDGTVSLFNLPGFTLASRFHVHLPGGSQHAIAISPGGQTVAVYTPLVTLLDGTVTNRSDPRVYILDGRSGKSVCSFEVAQIVYADYIGASSSLITLDASNTLQVWDLPLCRSRFVVPLQTDLSRVVVAPREGLIATVHENGRVETFNTHTPDLKEEHTIAQHFAFSDICAAGFAFQNRELILISRAGGVLVYDLDHRKVHKSYTSAILRDARDIALEGKGGTCIAELRRGKVLVYYTYDLMSGQYQVICDSHFPTSTAFCEDHDEFVVADIDGILSTYRPHGRTNRYSICWASTVDNATKDEPAPVVAPAISSATGEKLRGILGSCTSGHDIAFTPDGTYCFVGEPTAIREIDLVNGRQGSLICKQLGYIAVSPGGRLQRSGKYMFMKGGFPTENPPKSSWVFDLGVIWDGKRRIGSVEKCEVGAFSPDGRSLATVRRSRELAIWQIDPFQLSKRLTWGPQQVPKMFLITSISYSSTGRLIAVCEGDYVLIWDVETGTLLHVLRDRFVDTFYQCVFTPDEKRLIAVSRTALDVFDVSSGEKMVEFPDPFTCRPSSLGFSRDGLFLVSASSEGSACVLPAEPFSDSGNDREEFLSGLKYLDEVTELMVTEHNGIHMIGSKVETE